LIYNKDKYLTAVSTYTTVKMQHILATTVSVIVLFLLS